MKLHDKCESIPSGVSRFILSITLCPADPMTNDDAPMFSLDDENDDSVEGHLRRVIHNAAAENTGVPETRPHLPLLQRPPRCLRDEMNRFMDSTGAKQVSITFDRINPTGKTQLRLKVTDREAIVFAELTGEEAALLYQQLTGDPGFLG